MIAFFFSYFFFFLSHEEWKRSALFKLIATFFGCDVHLDSNSNVREQQQKTNVNQRHERHRRINEAAPPFPLCADDDVQGRHFLFFFRQEVSAAESTVRYQHVNVFFFLYFFFWNRSPANQSKQNKSKKKKKWVDAWLDRYWRLISSSSLHVCVGFVYIPTQFPGLHRFIFGLFFVFVLFCFEVVPHQRRKRAHTRPTQQQLINRTINFIFCLCVIANIWKRIQRPGAANSTRLFTQCFCVEMNAK